MATSIERFHRGRSLPTRSNRALGQIEADAAIAAHRVRAVSYVAACGLQSVTQLATCEAECAKLAPESALRLAAIGDAATAITQQIVMSLGSRF